MSTRDLIVSFEGPERLVRPERCDVRPLLGVLLAFVQLVEKIGAYEAALDTNDAPFAVVLKELRGGSIKNVLGFVPRRQQQATAAARAGLDAARAAPKYLERRSVGPTGVRVRARRLAAALGALPRDVKAHLRGSVDASLSDLAASPPAATVRAVESFRARILRAGGLSPRVQLQLAGHARPITLDAPEALAKRAGTTLYAEADVTAEVERTAENVVLHGRLTDLRILASGDPVSAFDRWYARAGKPWSEVADIEKELRRGHR